MSQCLGDHRGGRGRVDAAEPHDAACGAAEPLPVLDRPPEGVCGRLGVGERGHGCRRAEGRGRAACGEDRGENRLVELLRCADGAADRGSDIRGLDRGGRDEECDHRVHAGIGEDERQCTFEALRGRRAEHVDRVRKRRLDRKPLGESRARLVRRRGQLEAGGLACVGAEDAEPAGVRQHRHAAAPRDGLRREQGGDVEQGGKGVGADDAGLPEDGVDRGVGTGEGSRVGAGRLLARARPAALHREDRLLPREPAGDPRELARVAERLEVHEDEVGTGVVLPPLEQVVGGDVRLVADGDESREPEPAGLRALEQCETEGARLGAEADPPRRECPRGERRIHADRGARDPEAVRADEPCPVRTDERQQLLLAGEALGAGLGEPRRDDAERARARAQCLLRGRDDVLAGKADRRRGRSSRRSPPASGRRARRPPARPIG